MRSNRATWRRRLGALPALAICLCAFQPAHAARLVYAKEFNGSDEIQIPGNGSLLHVRLNRETNSLLTTSRCPSARNSRGNFETSGSVRGR
jgi:hypothetical protein